MTQGQAHAVKPQREMDSVHAGILPSQASGLNNLLMQGKSHAPAWNKTKRSQHQFTSWQKKLSIRAGQVTVVTLYGTSR